MNAAKVLARFAMRVEQTVGITVSIGLSCNKFLAKIASDLDKPRGFAVLGGTEAKSFLAPRPVTLIYGTQTLADVIFREELAAIEKRHPNFRLHLLPSVVDDPNWAGPKGYLTAAMILGFVPNIARARVHMCGPTPMMAAVLPILKGLGVNEGAIFTEAFTSLPFEPGPGADEEVSMTFAKSGKTVIARRGEGLIRVAEANGIAMDYSCRNGDMAVPPGI